MISLQGVRAGGVQRGNGFLFSSLIRPCNSPDKKTFLYISTKPSPSQLTILAQIKLILCLDDHWNTCELKKSLSLAKYPQDSARPPGRLWGLSCTRGMWWRETGALNAALPPEEKFLKKKESPPLSRWRRDARALMKTTIASISWEPALTAAPSSATVIRLPRLSREGDGRLQGERQLHRGAQEGS